MGGAPTKLEAPQFQVRKARSDELEQLPAIERAAQELFEPYGCRELYAAYLMDPDELRRAQRSGRLFVASAEPGPVGFAVAAALGPAAQLAEVDVHPAWGRRGAGTALVMACLEWAEARGFSEMLLSTMRDPPWNAPFYARLGFEPVSAEDFTPHMRRLRAEEARRGFPVADRVIMRRGIKRRS